MNVPARTWVEVSRSRITQNLEAIRAFVGSAVIVAPVVKADAYGHGAVEVSRVLVKEGVEWLEVSCTEEGVALRKAGIHCRILVMGKVLPFEREAAFGAHLTPVVHALPELQELDAMGYAGPVHLKIDTGMSRLGTRASIADVVEALRSLRCTHVEGLMSHFASAEYFRTPQTEQQIALFDQYCQALHQAGLMPEIVHFSSTNGVAFSRRAAWRSMVRPGLSVYGYVSPPPEGAPPLGFSVEPVLRWQARLVSVKDIPAGTLVGYGGRFRAPHVMRIGVIAAGYADGVPHRLGNRGHVIAAGRNPPSWEPFPWT